MSQSNKVLVLAPHFMNYEVEIVRSLKKVGADVFYYDQRSVSSPIGRAASKKIPSFFKHHNIRHFNRLLDEITFVPDIILVIQGDMLEKKSIEAFRTLWPNVKINLYLWDNLNNLKGVEKKLSWFDNAFSFDKKDSEKHPELSFLPLFFIDNFSSKESVNLEYDLTFIGTIHSDRYRVLNEIEKQLSNLDKKMHVFKFLQAKWLFWIYKCIKPEFRNSKKNDFSYEPMGFQEVESLVKRSFAVVDIQHPLQNGLTIRTIEMVGMGKKIITTNDSIKAYPFYNDNNILVIDRNNIRIPIEFFETDFQQVDSKIINDFKIESWLKKVLSVGD